MYTDRHDKYEDDHRYSAANVIGINPRDWNFLKSATSLFNKDGFIVPSKWSKSVHITDTSKLTHVRITITTSHRKNRGTFCLDFSDNTYDNHQMSFDNKESQLKSMPSSNLSREQQLLFAMLTNLIPALKIEIKDLKRKEKEMSKAIAKLKLDRKNRPIEQKLEHILHEHNISFKPWMDIFSLSGDNCRRLAERHVNIFKEVQEVILANVPSASSVNQAALDTFNNSVDLLFHKLSLLASLFDTISVVMNDITAQNAQSIEEFEIMCHLFGSLWRKCNLNVTPKVHMMEHLPMIMQMYGRIGLFNENPIERVHILNNRWNKTLESLKSWEHLVQLKFQRENVCKTKPVYDALSKFAQFQMRKSNQTKKGSGHSHVSFAEIIKLIGDFDKNQDDLDDQLKDLISPETQVYDMEGGMEEVDLGVGVVAVGDT